MGYPFMCYIGQQDPAPIISYGLILHCIPNVKFQNSFEISFDYKMSTERSMLLSLEGYHQNNLAFFLSLGINGLFRFYCKKQTY